jgi:hypothetical protein
MKNTIITIAKGLGYAIGIATLWLIAIYIIIPAIISGINAPFYW